MKKLVGKDAEKKPKGNFSISNFMKKTEKDVKPEEKKKFPFSKKLGK